jgi:hypothetical protein
MMNTVCLIKNVLVDQARNAQYPRIEYDEDGYCSIKLQEGVIPETPEYGKTKEVRCSEVESSFAEDKHNKKAFADKRQAHFFILEIGFSHEVSLENFENVFTNPKGIISIPPDPTIGNPKIFLHLLKSSYTHPKSCGPQSATKAEFLFKATSFSNP